MTLHQETAGQKCRPVARVSRPMMLLIGVACIALVAACVSPPAPANTESAAISIIIEKQWSAGGSKENSHRVYFIRWNDSDDPTKQNDIIESNYHRDGRVYLLNAKPGRYSAVAATDFIGVAANRYENPPRIVRRRSSSARPTLVSLISSRPGADRGSPLLVMGDTDVDGGDQMDEYTAFTTYFSEDLVNKTSVVVREGEFAVMGRFQVLMSWGIRSGDRVQVYFFHAIGRKMSDPLGMPIFDIDHNLATRARLVKESRSKETRREILELALGDFRGSTWEPILRRQVNRPG